MALVSAALAALAGCAPGPLSFGRTTSLHDPGGGSTWMSSGGHSVRVSGGDDEAG